MLTDSSAPEIAVAVEFEFSVELRAASAGRAGESPLHRESIQHDLADLVEETYVRGVLGERLPAAPERLAVSIAPLWHGETTPPQAGGPVRALLVRVAAGEQAFELAFEDGRWLRRCQAIAASLQREGTLGADDTARVRVVAEPAVPGRRAPRLAALQAPEIVDATLEDLGVRALEPGTLDPERPVLVGARMVEEILTLTERAGANETGGATLGRIARLPRALPGATTRIVTLLSASFADARHVGLPGRFTFSPQALVDAVRIAELRGLGESVLTAFHSHGWGSGCNRCNQNEACVLPQVDVSLDDHRLLEGLFPGRATLLPIAGRRLGAPGERPVLEIHAWRGGRMASVPWRAYRD
jgi:hypothetical protein